MIREVVIVIDGGVGVRELSSAYNYIHSTLMPSSHLTPKKHIKSDGSKFSCNFLLEFTGIFVFNFFYHILNKFFCMKLITHYFYFE